MVIYGYIPNPYGRDLGLGYRVRTLPQGFLSPTRGTERVVKTIEDRWGKYSTVGRLHPSRLRRVSVPCEGNRKGRKAYCGLVRMWSSLWLKILQMSAMKVCFQIAECS